MAVLAPAWYQRRVSINLPGSRTPDGSTATGGDPNTFGTVAFYASVGRAFFAMCAFIPVLWAIELVDWATGQGLDPDGGIRPRSLSGIDGIVFAPFLHGSFTHLASNSVPLLLLGTFVLAGQVKRFFLITGFIMLISGLSVWLFSASNTVTVGASGVIFGYLGYLLLRGIIERSWWGLAVGALVGLLYGWTISGVLPGTPHVSWQAHLGGFIAGLAAAILFRRRRPKKTKPAEAVTSGTTITMPGTSTTQVIPPASTT